MELQPWYSTCLSRAKNTAVNPRDKNDASILNQPGGAHPQLQKTQREEILCKSKGRLVSIGSFQPARASSDLKYMCVCIKYMFIFIYNLNV